MQQIIRALAFLAMLLPGVAAAQCNSSLPLPVNTVLGRLGINPGPCQAIPFSVLLAQPGTLKTITTTAPLAGGGPMNTNLTLTCATCGVTGSPLSQFAATTSAQLAATVSDETGTGSLVFGTSPTLVTPNLGTPSAAVLTNATGLPVGTGVGGLGTGVATFLGTPTSANLKAALTDETGSGAAVFATSPTFVTPTLGAATATTINGNTFSPSTFTLAGAGGKTFTFNNTMLLQGTDGTSFTLPAVNATIAGLGVAQTWTGIQSYTDGTLILLGLTSGSSILKAPATGGGTATLFAGTDTIAGLATAQTFTNKTMTASNNVLGGVTMTLGSDSIGDVYYRNSSGFLTRLPIGSTGNLLSVVGGIPAWEANGQIVGESSTGNAATGNVGEYVTGSAASSTVSLTTVTAANCVSISLTAGDWDVSGNIFVTGNAATTVSYVESFISTTTATRNQANSNTFYAAGVAYFGTVNGSGFTVAAPTTRVSISGLTTVFLEAFPSFGTNTATCGGTIRARRVR